MKYKVTIQKDGTWNTTVIDPGKHKCADIIQVVGSFGSIKDIRNKKDDVPVKDSVHVGGNNV